jgi:hypothetical protein
VRKFINTRVNEKTLEPADTSIDERGKLGSITRNDASPKGRVNDALPFGSSQLFIKSRDGGRGRNTI